MASTGLRNFVSRRLSRSEYLGLHLTVGLLLTVLLLGVFLGIAQGIDRHGDLTRFDVNLSLAMKEHRAQWSAVRYAFYLLTWLGAWEILRILVPLVAVFLWWRRRRLLAVVWLGTMIISALLNQGLKVAYGRERPETKDALVHENNASFPSGHSTASMVGFGFLAYLLWLATEQRRARLAIVGGAGLLILGIGFSRIYLGAHYLSDVIGGFCLGAAWLSVCISGVESVRRLQPAPVEASVSIPVTERVESS